LELNAILVGKVPKYITMMMKKENVLESINMFKVLIKIIQNFLVEEGAMRVYLNYENQIIRVGQKA
jgi:hypothetical protein